MNIVEHQLKSKLAGPVCTEHETKTKKTQEQWLQLKWSFYYLIIWKLLFIEGLVIDGGQEGQMGKFLVEFFLSELI